MSPCVSLSFCGSCGICGRLLPVHKPLTRADGFCGAYRAGKPSRSAWGHSRHFGRVPVTSGLPPIPDIAHHLSAAIVDILFGYLALQALQSLASEETSTSKTFLFKLILCTSA